MEDEVQNIEELVNDEINVDDVQENQIDACDKLKEILPLATQQSPNRILNSLLLFRHVNHIERTSFIRYPPGYNKHNHTYANACFTEQNGQG